MGGTKTVFLQIVYNTPSLPPLSLSLPPSLLPPLLLPSLPPPLLPSLPPCSRVVAVAGDLFSVYRQTLELLQVQWHPHQPGTLCLLTSDDTLRVFSLANPNVPLLTFPLSAPTPLHGCALDDSVVAFSLLSTAIFILRDTGDVHLSSLSPDAPCSPPSASFLSLFFSSSLPLLPLPPPFPSFPLLGAKVVCCGVWCQSCYWTTRITSSG